MTKIKAVLSGGMWHQFAVCKGKWYYLRTVGKEGHCLLF